MRRYTVLSRHAAGISAMLIGALLLSACAGLSVPSTLLAGEPTQPPTQESTPEATAPVEPTPTPAEVAPTPAPSTPVITDAAEQELEQLYEQANPAVVNIRVTQKVAVPSTGLPFPFSNLPGFRGFGFHFGTPDETLPQDQYTYGEGSGFVYDEEGHIVTNSHVVKDAERIMVTFADDTTVQAEVVGIDPDSDLAVIKVDPEAVDLQPLPLGDSDALKVGQRVVAIGNPFGLEGTMTTGIVSALGRVLPSQASAGQGQAYSIPDVIQTDAAINPGNSGGPLLNMAGEVIGVNTAIESTVQQFSGVGFAVPSNTVARVVPQLIEKGKVEHPWLGISGLDLLPELAKPMGLPEGTRGVLIIDVASGSPAEEAGLLGSKTEVEIDGQKVRVGGDVIVAVDGREVRQFDTLLSYLTDETHVGQTITLTILRDGKEQDVEVTLADRPASE
jgi:S1-C subfamily serine protease